MPSFNELIFYICIENVKPDDYGYYSVNDMVMSKEDWIEYCNDIKSDRKILDQGKY